jgi:pyrophosphatase PpaX
VSARSGFDPILFDLDGTVIDTVTLIRESHRHAVRTVLGEEFSDERLVANVGRPLLEQMVAFSPEHAEELYRVYREWNHAHTAELIESYDGVAPLLQRLTRAGRTLGLVTSKTRDAVDLAFESLPIGKYFDIVISADDTSRHKPDPEPIRVALEGLGRTGDGGCYIGDSPFDIQAGHGAGITTIAVTWGFFGRSDLEQVHPDIVCETAAELGQVLLGHP